MKNIFLCVLSLSSFVLHAQYYYNDIIGTMETNRMMKSYLDNKVLTVTATGIDANGRRADDFSELQEVKENGKALKITTRNSPNTTIFYNRFDSQGRLISVTDSSGDIQSLVTYTYDANGKISMIQNTTRDTANDFNQAEIHRWTYNASGKPEKMWRTINNSDSLEVRFIPDDQGNAGDERSFKRGIETGVIYYYYDDKHRLTDVVRFNKKSNKLLPDLMFEYDDSDRVIQKITTTSSLNLSYLIWRYLFNEKGLKTKEALFNKDKEITGKIEYAYTFRQ